MSTGRFTKEARYEADRAVVPLTLIASIVPVRRATQLHPSVALQIESAAPRSSLVFPERNVELVSKQKESPMSAEEQVREASERFYAALSRMAQGTIGAMDDIWSHGPGSTAMHPIAGREVGWDSVRNSFDQFAQIATAGHVALKEQSIRVLGDVAYELGVEYGGGTLGGIPATWEHRVTNIYHREDGAWKMVHHHSDVSPTMMDVLRRLQAKTSA